jgi:urocanate hydratase
LFSKYSLLPLSCHTIIYIGLSQYADMLIAAQGTLSTAKRLKMVLRVDPEMSVVRHGNAGYNEAIEAA